MIVATVGAMGSVIVTFNLVRGYVGTGNAGRSSTRGRERSYRLRGAADGSTVERPTIEPPRPQTPSGMSPTPYQNEEAAPPSLTPAPAAKKGRTNEIPTRRSRRGRDDCDYISVDQFEAEGQLHHLLRREDGSGGNDMWASAEDLMMRFGEDGKTLIARFQS